MRAFLIPFSILGPAVLVVAVACVPQLSTGDDSTSSSATVDAGASAEAGFTGGGCGVETTTGATLCIATTMCPSLVIDTDAMPHCGFRLRNGVADLVCACGTSICSMGIYDTCDQATALLASQTEAAVCTQVADGRCLDAAGSTGTTTTTTTQPTSTSSSSSASSGGIGCDTQCVKDCGGGEACASVCNCS